VLAFGLAIDAPAHPAADRGLDRLFETQPLCEPARDVVGEVAAVAAVEEVADPE
jgi:hypothetical protein